MSSVPSLDVGAHDCAQPAALAAILLRRRRLEYKNPTVGKIPIFAVFFARSAIESNEGEYGQFSMVR